MVAIATIYAQKPIPFTISPVPSTTLATKLRSLKRIFAYYLDPYFFAASLKQCRKVPIEPMGQPPVKHARERPSFAVFNFLEVFNGNHLHLREIYLLQCLTQFRFYFTSSIFLAFSKTLNSLINILASYLTITEYHSVFIVGIHSYYKTCSFLVWFWLFYQQINKNFSFSEPQSDRFCHCPTISQLVIERLSTFNWNYQARCARPYEANSPIKMFPLPFFKSDKVIK